MRLISECFSQPSVASCLPPLTLQNVVLGGLTVAATLVIRHLLTQTHVGSGKLLSGRASEQPRYSCEQALAILEGQQPSAAMAGDRDLAGAYTSLIQLVTREQSVNECYAFLSKMSADELLECDPHLHLRMDLIAALVRTDHVDAPGLQATIVDYFSYSNPAGRAIVREWRDTAADRTDDLLKRQRCHSLDELAATHPQPPRTFARARQIIQEQGNTVAAHTAYHFINQRVSQGRHIPEACELLRTLTLEEFCHGYCTLARIDLLTSIVRAQHAPGITLRNTVLHQWDTGEVRFATNDHNLTRALLTLRELHPAYVQS